MTTRQLIDLENTRRERRWLEKHHPLRQLFWECTLRCNLSCRHCGSDCRKEAAVPDMPLEHFIAVLDDVATMTAPSSVLVNTVGGEPLVRPDIVECGRAITSRGFLWGFVTNGVLLTESLLSELLDAGFVDTWRALHPDVTGVYSWWSYRFNARKNNAGWRIDYFLVSEALRSQVEAAEIYGEVFGSDHCPVALELAV